MCVEIDTIEKFQLIVNSPKKNIVVFYRPECTFCRWYMKRLHEHFSYIDYYAVDVSKNYDWYLKNHYTRLFYPFTIIYKNGEILYKISGELYPLQIKGLWKAFNDIV